MYFVTKCLHDILCFVWFKSNLFMRQIQSDYAFVAGRHDVIFKVCPLVVLSLLHTTVVLQLDRELCCSCCRSPDRFEELTQTVLSLDDVEVFSVSLREGEWFWQAAPPGLLLFNSSCWIAPVGFRPNHLKIFSVHSSQRIAGRKLELDFLQYFNILKLLWFRFPRQKLKLKSFHLTNLFQFPILESV